MPKTCHSLEGRLTNSVIHVHVPYTRTVLYLCPLRQACMYDAWTCSFKLKCRSECSHGLEYSFLFLGSAHFSTHGFTCRSRIERFRANRMLSMLDRLYTVYCTYILVDKIISTSSMHHALCSMQQRGACGASSWTWSIFRYFLEQVFVSDSSCSSHAVFTIMYVVHVHTCVPLRVACWVLLLNRSWLAENKWQK